MKDFKIDTFIHDIKTDNNYRYERKFIVPDYYSVKEVEQEIKSNSWFFSKIFQERQINNIYFDTNEYQNYFDNVLGVSNRKKIRIRWYGNTFGKIKNPILEVKTKQGLVGNKLSSKLKPFILDNKFTSDYVDSIFSNSNLPKPILEDLKMNTPTLLNSYQRKYYLSADRRFRITLDFDLKYYKVKIRFNNFNKTPIKDLNKIIELKYALTDDNDAKKIASQFSSRLHKNSKYVNGIYSHMHFTQ